MHLVIITLARLAAIKAVKRDMQARGLKPTYIERKVIVAEANSYLRDHPELLEQAADTVERCPELRALADRIERDRSKLRTDAQSGRR
jgi:hypothetical protein